MLGQGLPEHLLGEGGALDHRLLIANAAKDRPHISSRDQNSMAQSYGNVQPYDVHDD